MCDVHVTFTSEALTSERVVVEEGCFHATFVDRTSLCKEFILPGSWNKSVKAFK